jgi:nitronate monooxygenase
MLAAGADGAMAGTPFIPTAESRAHPRFKERVIAAGADDTVITTIFDIGWPGRPHRVIRNPLTESPGRRPAAFIAATTAGGRELPVPRYSAAAPLAQTTGCVEEMAMYCGRSCERVTSGRPVHSLLMRFRQEYEQAGSLLITKQAKGAS